MTNVYVPTRFFSLSYADNGSLILSNTLTGAIGAVPPEQAQEVRAALRRDARHLAPLDGFLKDLEHGGFLIEEGTNEQSLSHRKFLERYRDESLHFIILPNEQCNFQCVYCYESFLRGTMSESIREGVKQYVANQEGLREFRVSWFGGEPLLASDVVVELSQYFYQYCANNRVSFSASATTNGYYLTPDIADKLIPYGVREFQITLDGVQDEHDQRRVLAEGGGTFDRMMENLRHLKESEHVFVVTIRNNFDPGNMARVEDFIAMLKEEFAGDPEVVSRPVEVPSRGD